MLASLVLRAMIANGQDGYLTTFSSLIEKFTAGWYDADDRQWFHRRIKNTGVLVIDDIGREMKRSVNLPESTFDEVLRHRIAAGKPTIVTTNCTLDQLHTGYGGNVMSLLTERSTSYEFTGSDFRGRSKESSRAGARPRHHPTGGGGLVSRLAEYTLILHLTDAQSLETIAAEGLDLDIIPTEELRPGRVVGHRLLLLLGHDLGPESGRPRRDVPQRHR